MRVAVIINPVSGRRRRRSSDATDRAELARLVLARVACESGVDPDIAIDVTRAPGHAAELARDHVARGIGLVVAWGGDGTVHEVAGPLIGSSTALAIVPSGSGDGLARGLGLPRRPEQALRLALTGPIGSMDTGRIGDRHFLNIAGVGFDAAVGAAFNQSARRGVGAYVRGALAGVWTYRPEAYRLVFDGVERAGRCFVIVFANGPQYGNGLCIAPDADPADGRLNLVLVADGSAWRQVWRARRLGVRRLARAEGVHRQLVETASVEGDRLVCHVDGETFETSGRLKVGVRPASLTIAGTG